MTARSDARTQSQDSHGDQVSRQYSSALSGFKVYVSTAPMCGDIIPSEADVHAFDQSSSGGGVYARRAIWTHTASGGLLPSAQLACVLAG